MATLRPPRGLSDASLTAPSKSSCAPEKGKLKWKNQVLSPDGAPRPSLMRYDLLCCTEAQMPKT